MAESGGATESAPEAVPSHSKGGVVRFARRAVIVLASVVALVLTAVGWVALDRGLNTSKVLSDVPSAAPKDDGATDILFVGNDSRTDAQGDPLPLSVLKVLRTEQTTGLNTDTLILMRIPHNGAPPTAVSIPRDTNVIAPRLGSGRINGVYGLTKQAVAERLDREGVTDSDRVHRESALAGQRALVGVVQDLTGTRIDHYAEVNLLGFYEITRTLGGVDVCLKQATSDKDSGAEFAAGPQTIEGGDALAFVRQRQGLPRGDLDRVVRQQVFLAALANKVLSTGTLTDPGKLRGLLDAAHRSVVLDEGWNMGEFTQRMQEIAGGSVRFETLPINAVGARNDRGQSVILADPTEVRAFVAGLARKPPGLAPAPLLQLDATAHRTTPPPTAPSPPITSNGIPCVN